MARARASVKSRSHSPLQRNSEEKQLQAVDADGACLFRCFSLHIYGTEDYHLDIRKNTVNELKNHPEHYQDFCILDGERRTSARKFNVNKPLPPVSTVAATQKAYNKIMNAHFKNMSKPCKLGDHREIQAFA